MSEVPAAEPRRRSRVDLPLGLQFSLSEALTLLGIMTVGAAALTSGGLLAIVFVQLAWWTIFGIALSTLIFPGVWRLFAIGFVFGVASYGLPVLYVGESEFNPYTGRLALTRALTSLWDVVHRTVYVDPSNERAYEEGEVETRPGFTWGGSGDPSRYYAYYAPDGAGLNPEDRPDPGLFMLVGHALMALTIGYAFGKLATVLYRSQIPPTTSDPDRR